MNVVEFHAKSVQTLSQRTTQMKIGDLRNLKLKGARVDVLAIGRRGLTPIRAIPPRTPISNDMARKVHLNPTR